MKSPSASIRALAQQLLAAEAANASTSNSQGNEAMRVYEKLREPLVRFIGPEGVTALARRAVALARTEVPSLHAATVAAGGRLEGMEDLAAEAGANADAATAFVVHLLGLLVAFIGAALTLRLVRDVWPEASLDE